MRPEPVPSLLHGIIFPGTRSQPWQGSELFFLRLGFVISCLVAAGSGLARANSQGELMSTPGPNPVSPALPAQPATGSSGFSQANPPWETALIKRMGWFELIPPSPEGYHEDIHRPKSADGRAKPLQSQPVVNSKQ